MTRLRSEAVRDVPFDLVSSFEEAYPLYPNGSSHPLLGNGQREGQEVSDLKAAPTGTVTFFFTDVEGSTALIQELGGEYRAALESQEHIVRDAVTEHGGYVAESRGEELLLAFNRATDAVAAALEAQHTLASQRWPEGSEMRVRMGIHTGEAQLSSGIYVGLAIHRAARICAAGHGGQILLSTVTKDLVGAALPSGAELVDLGEYRLKDLGQPERLFQLVHPDIPRDFPNLRTLDLLPNNLPIQLTSFIGREREIEEVKRLLSSSRLVTLVGPGGSGKTRLALQVAAELLDAYPQGAWLVDLASTTDGSVIPQTVASILGVRGIAPGAMGPRGVEGEDQSRSLIDKILDRLRTGRALVVLDNCEHLVSESGALAESILRSCPHITVLVTSREPLGVPGEARWRVPPLDTPGLDAAVEQLTAVESVRLFVDRAALNQSDFVLSEKNAEAVVQISRQLDGMPLAIELAAAWVSALSPQQILSRLDDQFRLLASGPRRGIARHQTLRATVDWSYELLTAPERRLLENLSIFGGGFTLEAAEQVCAGEGVDSDEVLHLLSRLVDKSLVIRETEGHTVRYRLLETIRQYGWEKVAVPSQNAQPVAESLDSTDEAVLRREGDYWTVGYCGNEFRLKHSKGLSYLHLLIASPGREIHVLEAVATAEGTSGGPSPDSGDAGKMLDHKARQEYKARLTGLQNEVEEARAWNDSERAAKAEAEIDFLAGELSAAVGLGGRDRRVGSASERARMSVAKALRGAIARIGEQSTDLRSVLRATVQTGTYLSYQPDPRNPLRWRL